MNIKNSFKNTDRFIDRVKIGQGAALTVALLGWVGFANAGPDVIVVRPPEIRAPIFPSQVVVGLPRPDFFLFGGDYDSRPEVRHYGHRGAESRGRAHRPEEGRRR
jgi:hypothetical protein